ncbi:MAG: hypothetical protein WB867_09685, partial [Candidatus Dormiibacterota bacterium]
SHPDAQAHAESDAEKTVSQPLSDQALAQPTRQAHPDPNQTVGGSLSQADSDAMAQTLSHAFAKAIRRFRADLSFQFPHRWLTLGRLEEWRSEGPSRSI